MGRESFRSSTPRLKAGACSWRHTAATIGCLTASLSNIDCSVDIRVAAETALVAAEGGLAFTICRGTVPAPRAGLGGIGRVYEIDWHARPGRLVGQEQAELIEGPAMPFVAVCA